MRAGLHRLVVSLASASTFLGTAVLAQAPTPPTDTAAAEQQQAARDRYNAMPDTPGTGPWPAIKRQDAHFPDHVIYHPANLAALGQKKLGVLLWGNGGCRADGASARLHLAEIASHGYLVVVPGAILSGPGAAPAPAEAPRPANAPPVDPVKTTAAQVLAGLDMALAENARPDSPFHGRIDPKLIAVSGTSCGGLQALQAAGDPRIRAVIVHNSGVFADGSNPIKGMTVDKSLLLKLHTPVLYILGGPSDVAFPNGSDDFDKIEHVPVALASIDVGHGGTFRQPNGGKAASVATDWLEWQLRGDRKAAARFTGTPCGLCTEPGWTVKRKKID